MSGGGGLGMLRLLDFGLFFSCFCVCVFFFCCFFEGGGR